jgi:hypothetical protein
MHEIYMETNAFIGKAESPTDQELAEALGNTKTIWDALVGSLATDYDVTVQEWKSYSPKSGWALRLKKKKRTIIHMSPCTGCFRLALILGDRAMTAAREGGLSARASKLLDEAVKYPEGTGIQMTIKSAKDIPTVKKLAVIKLAN